MNTSYSWRNLRNTQITYINICIKYTLYMLYMNGVKREIKRRNHFDINDWRRKMFVFLHYDHPAACGHLIFTINILLWNKNYVLHRPLAIHPIFDYFFSVYVVNGKIVLGYFLRESINKELYVYLVWCVLDFGMLNHHFKWLEWNRYNSVCTHKLANLWGNQIVFLLFLKRNFEDLMNIQY